MTAGPRMLSHISFLGRLILSMRLYALLLIVLWLDPALSQRSVSTLGMVIMVVALASFLPLWYWDRLAPHLVRRPLLLAADALVAVGLLFLTGVESPALHFALTTAALSGLLYGWAGALAICAMLVGGYELALASAGGLAGASFQVLVGAPALAPMAAIAGGSVRMLLERQDRTEAALHTAVHAAAAAEERARLARELHDSLTKTLHGITLSATALRHSTGRDDAPVGALAEQLAAATRAASEQARALISDLRADRIDQPLDDVVRGHVEPWAARAGVDAAVELSIGGAHVDPEARYEVLCIVTEALRNVERHARASRVQVRAWHDEASLTVEVVDDGVGFDRSSRPEELASAGHYGLIGMAERARRVGGQLDVRSSAGAGTRVSLRLPVGRTSTFVSPRAARSIAKELPL